MEDGDRLEAIGLNPAGRALLGAGGATGLVLVGIQTDRLIEVQDGTEVDLMSFIPPEFGCS